MSHMYYPNTPASNLTSELQPTQNFCSSLVSNQNRTSEIIFHLLTPTNKPTDILIIPNGFSEYFDLTKLSENLNSIKSRYSSNSWKSLISYSNIKGLSLIIPLHNTMEQQDFSQLISYDKYPHKIIETQNNTTYIDININYFLEMILTQTQLNQQSSNTLNLSPQIHCNLVIQIDEVLTQHIITLREALFIILNIASLPNTTTQKIFINFKTERSVH